MRALHLAVELAPRAELAGDDAVNGGDESAAPQRRRTDATKDLALQRLILFDARQVGGIGRGELPIHAQGHRLVSGAANKHRLSEGEARPACGRGVEREPVRANGGINADAGQTVRLHFSATTDGSLTSSFFVDDVSVR